MSTVTEVASAKYWLSWIRFGRRIAAFMVAIAVAGELALDTIAEPLRKRIDDAHELELTRLKTEGEKFRLAYERLRQHAQRTSEQSVAHELWTDSADKSQWLKQLGVDMNSLAGTPLFIQPVPDFHVQLFAERFAAVMRQHEWKVEVVDETVTRISPLEIPPWLTLYAWDFGTTRRGFEADPSLLDTDPGWLAALLLEKDLALRSGLRAPIIMTSSESDPVCGIGPQLIKFPLPNNGVLLTIGLLDEASIFDLQELHKKESTDESSPSAR